MPHELDHVRELKKYPEIVSAISTAATAPSKSVDLDLGELAAEDPFAAAEAIVLAGTLHVRLVCIPHETRRS